jgi:hypothetical protein
LAGMIGEATGECAKFHVSVWVVFSTGFAVLP